MPTGVQHQRPQIIPRYIVHDQVVALATGEEIGYFGQVGMVETRKHSGFAKELFTSLLQDFVREVAVVKNFF